MRASLPEPCRRRKRNCLRPPDSDDTDHAVLADALPRQAQHQAGQLFVRQGTLIGFAADVRPGELPPWFRRRAASQMPIPS